VGRRRGFSFAPPGLAGFQVFYPTACEAVTKLVPSAEADSVYPTSGFPALPCRAFPCRRFAADSSPGCGSFF
jgi:hypothetical protein